MTRLRTPHTGSRRRLSLVPENKKIDQGGEPKQETLREYAERAYTRRVVHDPLGEELALADVRQRRNPAA